MTAGMAPTKYTATITHVVTSMIQASVAGCSRKMTRWTGQDTAAVLPPFIPVKNDDITPLHVNYMVSKMRQSKARNIVYQASNGYR